MHYDWHWDWNTGSGEMGNLALPRGGKKTAPHPGPTSGYIAYCEGGEFHGNRGGATAYDNHGKVIKKFKGNSGDVAHQANFIDAVRSRDNTSLNADVAVGNDSTGWCNLANVAFRAGKPFTHESAESVSLGEWQKLVGAMGDLLQQHDLSLTDQAIKLSPILEMDPATEKFVGSNSETANTFLKRDYRRGFEVPEISLPVEEPAGV